MSENNNASSADVKQTNWRVISSKGGGNNPALVRRVMLRKEIKESIIAQRINIGKTTRQTAWTLRLPEVVIDQVIAERWHKIADASYREGYEQATADLANEPAVQRRVFSQRAA